MGPKLKKVLGYIVIKQDAQKEEGSLEVWSSDDDQELVPPIIECDTSGWIGIDCRDNTFIVAKMSGFVVYPDDAVVIELPEVIGIHVLTVTVEEFPHKVDKNVGLKDESPLLSVDIECEVVSLGDEDWLLHLVQ